jgi:hypothetical protein
MPRQTARVSARRAADPGFRCAQSGLRVLSVSKIEAAPSFETAASRPRQDEAEREDAA